VIVGAELRSIAASVGVLFVFNALCSKRDGRKSSLGTRRCITPDSRARGATYDHRQSSNAAPVPLNFEEPLP